MAFSRSWIVMAALLGMWCGAALAEQPEATGPTEQALFWTSGHILMPGEGFYPNGSTYNETEPLGRRAAWAPGNVGTLTWVLTPPEPGAWQVWVRRYGGYGSVEVQVNDQPITDGQGLIERGPRYVWAHHGEVELTDGEQFVDIVVDRTMFDLILFTKDENFAPQNITADDLPEPMDDPKVRGFRSYRTDDHLADIAGEAGLVLASVTSYEEIRYDHVPAEDDAIATLASWGSADQYIASTFAMRALAARENLAVSLTRLEGPAGATIRAQDIDVRVVHQRDRLMGFTPNGRRIADLPDLLLRDARSDELPPKGRQGGFGGGVAWAAIPANQTRQIWLTVHVPPHYPAGVYAGQLVVHDDDAAATLATLDVQVEVLPIDLQPVEGHYGIYYPARPVGPAERVTLSTDQYMNELRDQVRHGMNTTTLYGGIDTLTWAAEVGMTQSPLIMNWGSSSTTPTQIARARELGLGGVLHYVVDEPRSEAQLERALAEVKQRQEDGRPSTMAINSREPFEALKAYTTHPIMNIMVFGGVGNSAVQEVLDNGFTPISYWVTSMYMPTYHRAFAGLYNTACGYKGTMPWSYADLADYEQSYSANNRHVYAHPDEFGRPVPTLRWEAFREGVDDVRYLQALDRAIEAAAQRGVSDEAIEQARQVRVEHFESIRGRWFNYVSSTKPGDLDATRRAFADAIVALRGEQAAAPGG